MKYSNRCSQTDTRVQVQTIIFLEKKMIKLAIILKLKQPSRSSSVAFTFPLLLLINSAKRVLALVFVSKQQYNSDLVF